MRKGSEGTGRQGPEGGGKARWGAEERRQADRLVLEALQEDHAAEDPTTEALIPPRAEIVGSYVARQAGVVAGLPVVELVLARAAPGVRLEVITGEGDEVAAGGRVASLRGPASEILRVERVSLNFICHLSGIATRTREFCRAFAGVRVLDTRKTTPGWRLLEKYAVRVGGGENHRMALSEAVLIKDNHWAVLRAAEPGRSIADWVAVARRRFPELWVEVEVADREGFLEALRAGSSRGSAVDVIMLDNMRPDDWRWAVEARSGFAGEGKLVKVPEIEVSGGIDLQVADALRSAGVDRVAVGSLTHSVPALDMALEIECPGSDKRARPETPGRSV